MYEQVRVEPKDVPQNGLKTIAGTVLSRVMLQGDTNAPETLHRLMHAIFLRYIGRWLNFFFDDVTIGTETD